MKQYLKNAVITALLSQDSETQRAGEMLKALPANALYRMLDEQFYESVGECYDHVTNFYFDDDGSLYMTVETEDGKLYRAAVEFSQDGARFGEFVEVTLQHTVKHLGGELKVSETGYVDGYLVRFSDETQPDLDGEFFTAETDFGFTEATLPMLYHHGLDETIKTRQIGVLSAKVLPAGVWVEGQLALRDDYEKYILQMARTHKLGWSSGADPQSVKRVAMGNATWLKQWYIVEGSLTATPAEHRNTVSAKTKGNEMEDENVEDGTVDLRTEVVEAINLVDAKLTAKIDEKVASIDLSDYVTQGSLKALLEEVDRQLAELRIEVATVKSARELAAQQMVERAAPLTIADMLVGKKVTPQEATEADIPLNAGRYGKHAVGVGV
jgi:hypothetical protein